MTAYLDIEIRLPQRSHARIVEPFPTKKRRGDPATLEVRYWAKVAKAGPNDCWHWTAAKDTGSLGYGRIWRDGRNEYAHRIGYELANGAIPPGMQVLHSCDCPSCQNPAHLSIGTPADNMEDMRTKKRSRRALTSAEALEIDRLDREENWTEAALAKKFEVSAVTIRRLLSGTTWAHATERETPRQRVENKSSVKVRKPRAIIPSHERPQL